MSPSERQPRPAPRRFALLCDFANSLDLRRYAQGGAPLEGGDELASLPQLALWLRSRGLLGDAALLHTGDLLNARELRAAIRALLQRAPAQRRGDAGLAALLNAAAIRYSMALQMSEAGEIGLQPSLRIGASGLAGVLAELLAAAETAELDRLKMCESEECRQVFFDRSKSGLGRWCSAAVCGNREKTRAFRQRRKAASAGAPR